MEVYLPSAKDKNTKLNTENGWNNNAKLIISKTCNFSPVKEK